MQKTLMECSGCGVAEKLAVEPTTQATTDLCIHSKGRMEFIAV